MNGHFIIILSQILIHNNLSFNFEHTLKHNKFKYPYISSTSREEEISNTRYLIVEHCFL